MTRELMSDPAFKVFCEALTDSLSKGNSTVIAYADAYIAIEKAGFSVETTGATELSPDEFTLSVAITKTDADNRMAYGWASVIEENGVQVVDREGDTIPEPELIKAAHEFMKNYRQSKDLHIDSHNDGVGVVGDIVESILFTADVQKALGIDLKKVGWFIGVKISDDEVLRKVKSGEYASFSIGGSGVREPIE